MTMIEKVARALAKDERALAPEEDQVRWAETHWPEHVEAARVVIEAMREPTADMAKKFVTEWNARPDAEKVAANFSVFGMWKALIDAALSEK